MLRSHCPANLRRGYCQILRMAPLLDRIVTDLFARGFSDQRKELRRWQVAATLVGDDAKVAWEEAFQTPEMLADSFLDLGAVVDGVRNDDVVGGVRDDDAVDDNETGDDGESSSSWSSFSTPIDSDESGDDDAVDPAFRNDGLNHCYLWWWKEELHAWAYVYVTLGANLLLENPPVRLYLNTDFMNSEEVHTRRRYEPVVFHTVEEWEAYAPLGLCLEAARVVFEREFDRVSAAGTPETL